MPKVRLGNIVVECEAGANLRKVLMKAKLPLYHPVSRVIHCRGLGTCGTCAVKLRGSASWPTAIESLRLAIPPHTPDEGLRLACQCKVEGDLVVEKFAGVWGNHVGTHVNVEPSDVPAPRTAQLLAQRKAESTQQVKRPSPPVFSDLPIAPTVHPTGPAPAKPITVAPEIEKEASKLLTHRRKNAQANRNASSHSPPRISRVANGERPHAGRWRYLRNRFGR